MCYQHSYSTKPSAGLNSGPTLQVCVILWLLVLLGRGALAMSPGVDMSSQYPFDQLNYCTPIQLGGYASVEAIEVSGPGRLDVYISTVGVVNVDDPLPSGVIILQSVAVAQTFVPAIRTVAQANFSLCVQASGVAEFSGIIRVWRSALQVDSFNPNAPSSYTITSSLLSACTTSCLQCMSGNYKLINIGNALAAMPGKPAAYTLTLHVATPHILVGGLCSAADSVGELFVRFWWSSNATDPYFNGQYDYSKSRTLGMFPLTECNSYAKNSVFIASRYCADMRLNVPNTGSVYADFIGWTSAGVSNAISMYHELLLTDVTSSTTSVYVTNDVLVHVTDDVPVLLKDSAGTPYSASNRLPVGDDATTTVMPQIGVPFGRVVPMVGATLTGVIGRLDTVIVGSSQPLVANISGQPIDVHVTTNITESVVVRLLENSTMAVYAGEPQARPLWVQAMREGPELKLVGVEENPGPYGSSEFISGPPSRLGKSKAAQINQIPMLRNKQHAAASKRERTANQATTRRERPANTQRVRPMGRRARGRARAGIGRTLAVFSVPSGRSSYNNRRVHVMDMDEFVTNVSGSENFQTTAYPINIGMAGSFPWGSRVGNLYNKYDFEQLEYYYKPLVNQFSSQGGSGKVMLSADFDASDAPPSTKQQVESTDPHSDCMPYMQTKLFIGQQYLRRTIGRNVRSGTVAGTDVKTFDIGVFYFSTDGMSAIGIGSTIGELRVKYRVRLSFPELEPNVLAAGVYHYRSAAATTSDNFAAGSVASGSSQLLQAITCASNVITFPAGIPGNYLVLVQVQVASSALALSSLGAATALNLLASAAAINATHVLASNAGSTTKPSVLVLTITVPVAGAEITVSPATLSTGVVDVYIALLPSSLVSASAPDDRIKVLERRLAMLAHDYVDVAPARSLSAHR